MFFWKNEALMTITTNNNENNLTSTLNWVLFERSLFWIKKMCERGFTSSSCKQVVTDKLLQT